MVSYHDMAIIIISNVTCMKLISYKVIFGLCIIIVTNKLLNHRNIYNIYNNLHIIQAVLDVHFYPYTIHPRISL